MHKNPIDRPTVIIVIYFCLKFIIHKHIKEYSEQDSLGSNGALTAA